MEPYSSWQKNCCGNVFDEISKDILRKSPCHHAAASIFIHHRALHGWGGPEASGAGGPRP